MTPNELRQEVAAISQGHANEYSDKSFFAAANRALEQVNRIRPKVKSVTLYNSTLSLLKEGKSEIVVNQGHSITLEFGVCESFIVTASGRGNIVVLGERGEITRREIISPDVTTNYAFVVKNITGYDSDDIRVRIDAAPRVVINAYASYSDRYSDEEEDVPAPGIFNVHQIRRIAPDYIAITSLEMIDTDSEQILDDTLYEIASDTELWILRSRPGRYRMSYTYRLGKMSKDTADTPVAIDSDLLQPLILLTAHYLFYEDMQELSEHCYKMYMQTVADIKSEARASREPSFKNVYGW